jgi:hypothetical protein
LGLQIYSSVSPEVAARRLGPPAAARYERGTALTSPEPDSQPSLWGRAGSSRVRRSPIAQRREAPLTVLAGPATLPRRVRGRTPTSSTATRQVTDRGQRRRVLAIRSYLATAVRHSITGFDALTRAFKGNPRIPKPDRPAHLHQSAPTRARIAAHLSSYIVKTWWIRVNDATDPLTRDAADRMGRALWPEDQPPEGLSAGAARHAAALSEALPSGDPDGIRQALRALREWDENPEPQLEVQRVDTNGPGESGEAAG